MSKPEPNVTKPATTATRIQIESRADLRHWLLKNHDRSESIWLVTYKKHVGSRHVSYAAIVEEALCFGWIDSLPRALDDERTMLLLSPRKPTSAWSALNKSRVDRLTADGLMHVAGLAAVEAAKLSGRWQALDAVDRLVVPADLEKALAARKGASAQFEAFPRSVKRGILEWIANARRPETRAKRVAETADKAARGERANQWKR